MADFLSPSMYFGFFLSLLSFQLFRWINRRVGREVCNPLLFGSLLCIAVLLIGDIPYEVYYQGAGAIDFLLTPATICLAIPLHRQFTLLRKNVPAVLSGCAAGVAAHMAGCALMLVLFKLEAAEYISLLPKSITTAIGKSLSAELVGYPAITMVCIMATGIFGAVVAPKLLKLLGVTEPLAQGLAIGTASHAAGTSRAVELGDVQGAASSLAIVVTGLMTVVTAPLMAMLVG